MPDDPRPGRAQASGLLDRPRGVTHRRRDQWCLPDRLVFRAAAFCFWRDERRAAFQTSSTTMAPPIEPRMPLGRMLRPSPEIRLMTRPPTNDPTRPATRLWHPVDRAAAATDDQLGEPADEESEHDQREDQHPGTLTPRYRPDDVATVGLGGGRASPSSVVGVVPFVLDRDSFPLSTFPMFAADIDRTQSVDTAVAVDADGGVDPPHPGRDRGHHRRQPGGQRGHDGHRRRPGGRPVHHHRRPRSAAGGGDRRGAGPVAVEVVTERYDAVRWFDGDRTPVERVGPRPLPGGARDPHRGARRPGAGAAPPAGSSPPPPPPAWPRCAS